MVEPDEGELGCLDDGENDVERLASGGIRAKLVGSSRRGDIGRVELEQPPEAELHAHGAVDRRAGGCGRRGEAARLVERVHVDLAHP